MTKLVRHLIEDARRGSLAALLVLAGVCVGLTPAPGASPNARETLSRMGPVRSVVAGSSIRSNDRTAAADLAAAADLDPFIAPPPPRIVTEAAAWAEPAPFHGALAAVLPRSPGENYRARAPPAV